MQKTKHKHKLDKPRNMLSICDSLAQILSEDKIASLHIISQCKPSSVAELAEITGCKLNNRSWIHKTLARYNFEKLKKAGCLIIPEANEVSFNGILAA